MGNSIKVRLTVMSFLQFFVWGAWLITIGNYCTKTMGWDFSEFGAIFSTMGISSLFMPTITGIIADRWINAEKLYGILHFLGAIALASIPAVDNPDTFFWVIFGAMICYMPTIALSNSIAYHVLKNHQFDVIKSFPPIRVWGTVGFILAMWTTNICGFKTTEGQFYIAAVSAVFLAVYAFTLPACPPQHHNLEEKNSTKEVIVNAFKLFANYKMAVFFVFSMLLGAALQLTNMYIDTYLEGFSKFPEYANSIVVKYSTIISSISQISETLFILAIPFFLKKFGIKKVMLISMLAWVLRFGLLAYANPSDGLWMIIISCIVYGMAFDFFNVSGSLFVETSCNPRIRSSAQGMFMMMTNGVGAILGSYISGIVIDTYFSDRDHLNWTGIWLTFSVYALIVAVLFAILFRHKHNPQDLSDISH